MGREVWPGTWPGEEVVPSGKKRGLMGRGGLWGVAWEVSSSWLLPSLCFLLPICSAEQLFCARSFALLSVWKPVTCSET